MARTSVDQNGRVLLPAPLRRAMGLRKGSELEVQLDEHGRLVLVAVEEPWSLAQALFDSAERGGLVDELLAERREEAAREDA